MAITWPMVPLGDVLAKSGEQTAILPGQKYRQVTVRLWGNGVVLRDAVDGAEIGSGSRFVVRPQQFILSRIDARNGALGLVPESLDGAVVSNDFPVFLINWQRLSPCFLEWLSKTRTFVDLCRSASEGTTNRVRLQEQRFLRMMVPLPPLAEQQRIVARVDALAARIEEARGLRREAGEEAAGLVRRRARTILGELASEVSELRHWVREGDGSIQTGPFGEQLGSEDFTDSGVPVVTIGNVQLSGLNMRGLKHVSPEKASELTRFVIREGDILFARMGTVGRSCVAPKEAEGWLFNYHLIRVALDLDRVEPRFVHWTILASPDIEAYLGERIRGATREGVNTRIVGALPCRVPSLSEQRRIVACLDSVQAKVDALKHLQEETAQELAALLPSVLDRAFRGEL